MLIDKISPEKHIPEAKTAITQLTKPAIFRLIIETKQNFGNIHACTQEVTRRIISCTGFWGRKSIDNNTNCLLERKQ